MGFSSQKFPVNVQIQTSNKCNAACTFCPYSYTEGKKEFQVMEWDLYKKIIDECSEHNVQQILPFFLNEPLLNKDLTKYIDYAKEKNPKSIVKIFTNGSLLTNDKIVSLLNSKIDEVIFSFNGATKEEYETAMKNLEFEKTKERITDFVKRAKSQNISLAVHMLKLGLSGYSLNKIKSYWNKQGIAVHIFKYENRAGNVNGYEVSDSSNLHKIPCSRLLSQIYILVNGNVILCCADWNGEVIMGNLNSQSISEVWNGEIRLNYVKAHLKKSFYNLKLCDVCNFNETNQDSN